MASTAAGYHDEADRECSWPHLLKEPGINLLLPGFAIEQNQDQVPIDALDGAEPKANVPNTIADEEGQVVDEFHHFHNLLRLSFVCSPRFRRGTVF